MDEPRDWPAVLRPPQRNNFFFGKMMGVAQFEREQRYGMGQRWLINRLTIGTGVLCGLEVKPTTDGKRLVIAPGVAVDPWGREIVVSHPVDFDPFAAGGGCGCSDSAPITEAKDYVLCLTYRECTANEQPVQYANDCPGQPDCQPDTIVETFGLALSDVVTPAAFDCGKWTAAVLTGHSLVEVIERPPLTDSTLPARPPLGGLTDPGGTSSTPPSIDVLRARLAEQLGSSCAVPASTCVPLALVTAKNGGNTWTLTVADGPRRRIYTQAQLLEMILCLAKCCGDHPGDHPEEPPPPSETLRITGIEFLRLTTSGPPTNLIRELVPASPRQPGAYPPVFDASAYSATSSSLRWEPIVLRVTFNKAIEGSAVTLRPPLPSQPLGYTLMVGPLDVPPGQEIEAQVNLSNLEDANTVVMSCAGDPGAYTLIVRGDPVAVSGGPGLPAVTTWDLDPTKRRRLNGEVDRPPQFPSGKGGDGGDFEYSYELRELPPVDKPFRIERITFMEGSIDKPELVEKSTTLPRVMNVDRFRIVFNAPVNLASAHAGVIVTRAGVAVTGGIEPDPNNDPNAVIYVHREGTAPTPFPGATYVATLSASAIKDVPPTGGNTRLLSGRLHSPDPPLPSEGTPGTDDFVFDFTIKG